MRSWRELGFLDAAAPGDLQALGVTVTTPIAKGVARILRDATPAQLASREFRETVNVINREILQQPTAPDVLPLTSTTSPTAPAAPTSPPTSPPSAPAPATNPGTPITPLPAPRSTPLTSTPTSTPTSTTPAGGAR